METLDTIGLISSDEKTTLYIPIKRVLMHLNPKIFSTEVFLIRFYGPTECLFVKNPRMTKVLKGKYFLWDCKINKKKTYGFAFLFLMFFFYIYFETPKV